MLTFPNPQVYSIKVWAQHSWPWGVAFASGSLALTSEHLYSLPVCVLHCLWRWGFLQTANSTSILEEQRNHGPQEAKCPAKSTPFPSHCLSSGYFLHLLNGSRKWETTAILELGLERRGGIHDRISYEANAFNMYAVGIWEQFGNLEWILLTGHIFLRV